MTADPSGPRVLVTGATGTVGRHVVSSLKDRPAQPVAGVRDPDAAADTLGEAVPTVRFDFTRPETWGFAFEEVDSLFLLRPPGSVSLRTDILPAVDAAIRSGVEHVVYLSVTGADKVPILPHRRIERHLERAEVAYTFLRAAFFMQNLTEVHRERIVARDELFVPAGGGETLFVDARDVGEVAAEAFVDPAHRNRAYDVTGSERMDYDEVARTFSEVLDRAVTYSRPSTISFVRGMVSDGHPLGYVLVMVMVYLPTRLGLPGEPTDTVSTILGRDPSTLREFIQDNRSQFEPHRQG